MTSFQLFKLLHIPTACYITTTLDNSAWTASDSLPTIVANGCWWILGKSVTSAPPNKYATTPLLWVYLCFLCYYITLNILINYLSFCLPFFFCFLHSFQIVQLALMPNFLARTRRFFHNHTQWLGTLFDHFLPASTNPHYSVQQRYGDGMVVGEEI